MPEVRSTEPALTSTPGGRARERRRPFPVERLGLVMEPNTSDPMEAGGVLNPGAIRGHDGELYLFPRMVAKGNYSRIGIARVGFNHRGNPARAVRLGIALEPREPYELHVEEGTGGCEDARVTYLEPLEKYVMTYTGWSANGPRVAVAVSDDLFTWQRIGLAEFLPDPDPIYKVDFDVYHNKDAAFFPRAFAAPDGRLSLVVVHRPVYGPYDVPIGVTDRRPSVWISYCPLEDVRADIHNLAHWGQHQVLFDPHFPWEALRIGAGPPPVLTEVGWLLFYHGVSGPARQVRHELQPIEYAVGVVVMDRDDPLHLLYRSPEPILKPETGEETEGVVPNVVFPTGLDDRGNGSIDLYYGMADTRIGAARVRVPTALPAPGSAPLR